MNPEEMDELIFTREEYGKGDASKMTEGAKDLKRQVREFVKSLPTFVEKETPQK